MSCLSGDQSSLTNCSTCSCVAYCSDKCRSSGESLHSLVCKDLTNLIQDHRIDLSRRSQVDGFIHFPTEKYENLSQNFQEFLETQTRLLLPEETDVDFISSQARKLSWELTCPATVLYSAERAGLSCGPVQDQEELIIHLVGARKAEVEMAKSWLLLPARLPNLRRLKLVLIGPELENIGGLTSFTVQEGNCTVSYHLEHSAYHKFVKTKRFSEPNLVAALNCGFIFYQDWDLSLDCLVRRSGAPLVFTEYYEEDCKLNLAKLIEHCKCRVKVLNDCTSNPFCSRTAARIPAGFSLSQYGRKNILMSNDFICIVKIDK
ncbi:putative protein MSS51 homolog, mitochondrial [Eurytemora carolleeae]|uniref:putative protein MSS51 homolog, mitochondrial n=1 Tax=Eurytemora carolleeae TaxID=1294199 RepID=UPI000C786C4E|nr:putative protein MSS51 homolog, mitochondrial [Eurytemora carolleeae]|eukprot:XP_023323946.1 putative protein MSS51 homolog, mitochondrial [Eurytemora affinis]